MLSKELTNSVKMTRPKSEASPSESLTSPYTVFVVLLLVLLVMVISLTFSLLLLLAREEEEEEGEREYPEYSSLENRKGARDSRRMPTGKWRSLRFLKTRISRLRTTRFVLGIVLNCSTNTFFRLSATK